jgi:4,5-dihydroxyphthalate decarboxylase
MRKQITIACGVYDRTQALFNGTVKPEGVELNWLTPPRDEIWRRMLNFAEFDVSELSLSSYIIAPPLHKPIIAIPVFPARAFRHSYIFINSKSGIREPRDLRGKKVGVPEFEKTATVWVRGILQHEYGVSLKEIHWFTWAKQTRMERTLPAVYSVQPIPVGKEVDQMLIQGELHAIIAPEGRTIEVIAASANVRRLFENSKEVELAYYKQTGIFPIMHTVVLRQELWEEHPWLAVSLYEAFQNAKERAYQALNDPGPYNLSLLWFKGLLAAQKEVLGEDPWAYGLRRNGQTIRTLAHYLFEQELISREPSLEVLFAPNTLALDSLS